MNNQRGEVVTGVMIVIMAGMMLFGMVFMFGSHEDRQDRGSVEHKQESAEKEDLNTHKVDNAAEQASMSATKENK